MGSGCHADALDVTVALRLGADLGIVARGVIGVVRRSGADIHRAIVEVDTVDPLEDIAPGVLDVAVLNGCLTICAGCSTGMIGHAVRAAGVDGGAVSIDIAAADLPLAIPVSKLDQIQQPHGAPGSEVILRPLVALALGASASGSASDIHQRRSTRLGRIARDGVITADILAGAGVLGEAALGLIADIEVSLAVRGVIHDLEVILRDKDHGIVAGAGEAGRALAVADRVVDDVVLVHVLPRSVAVEQRTAGASADSGNRLGGDVDRHQLVRVATLGKAGKRRRAGTVVPAHAEDIGESNRHIAGLIRRGFVVRAGGYLDRDDRGTVGLCGHGDFVPAHADRRCARVAGAGADSTIAGASGSDDAGGRAIIQSRGALIQSQTARSLANAPCHGLRGDASVAPLVVGRRSEGSVVGTCVRAARGAANGHLGRVVVAPGRALCRAGVSQRTALAGNGVDSCAADLPRHGLSVRAAIAPTVVLGGGKGRIVTAGGGGRGRSAQRQLGAVIVVPGRRLGLAGIGQTVALRGDDCDSRTVDRPGHLARSAGAIIPGVILLGREDGGVGTHLRTGGFAADRQRVRIVAVPRGRLRAAGIGKTAVLTRNGVDGKGDFGHSLQRLVCGLLRLARGVCCVIGSFDRALHSIRSITGSLGGGANRFLDRGFAIRTLHLLGGNIVRVILVFQMLVNTLHAIHAIFLRHGVKNVLVAVLVLVGKDAIVFIGCHRQHSLLLKSLRPSGEGRSGGS